MSDKEIKNRIVKIKQYPLRWGILNTIKTYSSANLNGLVTAMRGNYSIHTIRKELRKMEKEEYIRSVRDENKNKVYKLKGHGSDYLEKIKIKSSGYDEEYYSDILLHWSVYVDSKKIDFKGFPEKLKELNALAINKENEVLGLVIEKNNESVSELVERIERIVKVGNIFSKMYYVSFSSNVEDKIPKEINSTKIEQYKYRAY